MENKFTYSNTNKRYHTFDYYLKNKYKEKVFKVSLNAGFSCPNRDGKISYGGCTFCSSLGGGENGGNIHEDLDIQFEKIKNMMHLKWPIAKYIAYFQAFSNTYAPVNILKEIYEPFVYKEDVVCIAIGTRADCLEDDVIDYLASIASRIDLWVEIGLQTSCDETARKINRGYDYKIFEQSVNKLRKHNINVTVHIINGLPNETKEMMVNTVKEINKLDIQGIKIHSLNILKDSIMGKDFYKNPFKILSRNDYIDVVIKQLENLRKEIVVQRLTSDPIKENLLAPMWNTDKIQLLNDIDKEMAIRDTYQGKALEKGEIKLSKAVSYYHNLIEKLASKEKIAVDATLGNGNDSLFLAPLFKKVYSFDIQDLAIKRSKEKLKHLKNVKIIKDNHMHLANYIEEKIDLIVFNLGYLPGSDKKICTNSYTTNNAIKNSFDKLNDDGVIIVVGYSRHLGGQKEIDELELFLENNKYKYTKKRFDYELVYEIKKAE